MLAKRWENKILNQSPNVDRLEQVYLLNFAQLLARMELSWSGINSRHTNTMARAARAVAFSAKISPRYSAACPLKLLAILCRCVLLIMTIVIREELPQVWLSPLDIFRRDGQSHLYPPAIDNQPLIGYS